MIKRSTWYVFWALILIPIVVYSTPYIRAAKQGVLPLIEVKTEAHAIHPESAQNNAKPAMTSTVNGASDEPNASLDTIKSKAFDSWLILAKDQIIRTDPDTASPILLQTYEKSWFPIVSQKNKWTEIQIGANQTAWVGDSLSMKHVQMQEQQIININPLTPLFSIPDPAFSSVSMNQTEAEYMPQQVSGTWGQVRSLNTGKLYWLPLSSMHWGYDSASKSWNVQSVFSVSSDAPLQGKTIVLDPGHGGKDVGAIDEKSNIKERDINFIVATVLAEKLESAGAKVILTRNSNKQYVSLDQRAAISNKNHADAFISIHQNMFPQDPAISGTITYFYDAKTSQQLADLIESNAVSLLHSHVEQLKVNQRELHVLDHNTRPAILIEGCFLSNPVELLNSITPQFREELAGGIFHGLLQYFHNH